MNTYPSVGYGFAYACWMRVSRRAELTSSTAFGWFHWMQFPPEPWEDGTPTALDYDNDCAP